MRYPRPPDEPIPPGIDVSPNGDVWVDGWPVASIVQVPGGWMVVGFDGNPWWPAKDMTEALNSIVETVEARKATKP